MVWCVSSKVKVVSVLEGCLVSKCLVSLRLIMYYVYTISLHGIIYYVGMTMQPEYRYLNHCTDRLSRLYYLHRFLLVQGKLPEMKIIHKCRERNQCLNMERKYIYKLSKKFFLLNNTTINYFYDILERKQLYRLKFSIKDTIQPEIYNIKKQVKNFKNG